MCVQDLHYLASITLNNGKVFALFVKSPTRVCHFVGCNIVLSAAGLIAARIFHCSTTCESVKQSILWCRTMTKTETSSRQLWTRLPSFNPRIGYMTDACKPWLCTIVLPPVLLSLSVSSSQLYISVLCSLVRQDVIHAHDCRALGVNVLSSYL